MNRSPVWLLAVVLAAALLLFGCSDQPTQTNDTQQPQSTNRAPLLPKITGGHYVDSSYIVVFKSSVGDVDRDANDIDQRYGISEHFRYKSALKGFAGRLSAAMLNALQNDPRVAYIEQDQLAHISTTQTNPPSWGLDRIDQHPLPLDNLYTYNQTGNGVDVYIIDTGIRTTHTDFGGRAVPGYDAVTLGGTANDGNGHGTHVAGTVGGTTYGVAKGVHLIAVRVLDNSGSGTYAQVIAGVNWVTSDHTTHPAVANMSLGGGVSTSLDAAIRTSISDGVTYCVAAGNSAADASTASPADVAEAITVGATDVTDAFAYFSNYGSLVDILAPGVSITSDWNTSNTATNTISGTSMATPHVTGSVALYLEANPTATPAAVQSGLIAAATSNVVKSVPAGTANRLLYALIGSASPNPPSIPVLSSPVNGATGVAIPARLAWNVASGAASYHVQVATDAGFGTVVYDQSGLTSTSTSVSGLSANTVYYWQVNATNANGTSAWSATWSFTRSAPAPPPAPTLSSPVNGATGVSRSPTLRWNASAGAVSYRIQVSTSSGFGTTVVNRSGVTTTSVSLSGLGSRTTYYWHVNATNANGTSVYSSTWQFRTTR